MACPCHAANPNFTGSADHILTRFRAIGSHNAKRAGLTEQQESDLAAFSAEKY